MIHTDIDGAASNGTTMTIKALTNMYLLLHLMDREQAGRIRLPYYLDEAADIDERNQQALIETSLQLGFVPILASVKPQVSAHVAIDLEGGSGRPASTSTRRTGNTSAAANRSPARPLLQPNGPKSRPDLPQRKGPRPFHVRRGLALQQRLSSVAGGSLQFDLRCPVKPLLLRLLEQGKGLSRPSALPHAFAIRRGKGDAALEQRLQRIGAQAGTFEQTEIHTEATGLPEAGAGVHQARSAAR